MPGNAQAQHGTSRLDHALDKIKPQPAPPRSPTPPPVDRSNWEHSVDSHKINTLTARDVGLIVFDETRSFTDRDNANDSLSAAREKLAHTVMNADLKFGKSRPSAAPPHQPSAKALENSDTRQAYNSSLVAAREAHLSGGDPTQGATNFKFLTNADRSNVRYKHGTPEGLPIRTQSGPFHNSFQGHDVHSERVYIDTYGKK